MVFENDPFEDFKRQRQIEILEKKFTRKAESRRNELGELVRSSTPSSELASRIHEEMQEFFQESQQHVSRMISQYDHPNTGSIERQVQDEMADFFRESTETAQDLLANLCSKEGNQDEAADRMVDHLKNVFKQSMDHIAHVRQQYGPPPVAETQDSAETSVDPVSMADLVQAINQSQDEADTFRYDPETMAAAQAPDPRPGQVEPPSPTVPTSAAPDLATSVREALAQALPEEAPIPAPPPRPEPTVQEPSPRRGPQQDRERVQPAGEDEESSSHRILRRQGHLAAGKARKVGLTRQEIGELRALKELLIDKGILTREEIENRRTEILKAGAEES